MSFSKITPADLNSDGALTLPDKPTCSAQELKRHFDAPAKEIVAPKFNQLIDDLGDTSAAANIGMVAPSPRTGTTAQAVVNSISSDLSTLEGQVAQAIADDHTHSNKALLDTYDQTNEDITDAVSKKHDHSNKALLDTYSQTEVNLADAVSKKHDHSNKALLDTYAQTETDLADAVSKKHEHSNKALLDTYNQTNVAISSAVSKAHSHNNLGVLDKFDEDSSGNPTYDGNPIGGGGSGDTFKTIQSGGTSFVASGEDTFKINAGSNVTITPLTGTDKGIQISATGGGQSTGDMLMSDYDSNGDVKTAGGIDAYVSGEIGKLDVSDSAVSGQYVSSVSETDGKISVTRASLPTVPTKVSDLTNDSGYQTASDVSTAIAGKADTSSLGDLAYIDKDGVSSTKVLQGDGTWVTPSTGGHTMIPTTNDIATIKALSDGDDNYVINAYSAKRWSNTESVTLLTTVNQGDDTMGTWEADDTWETSGVRTGWLCHELLTDILSDNDVEMTLVFDPQNSELVSAYAYRIDDHYTVTQDGVTKTVGGIAIKFNGAIQSNSVTVGVRLKWNRTQTITVTRS